MASFLLLVLSTLTIITTTSSLAIHPNKAQQQNSLPRLNSSDPVDSHYLDACTAILKGFDDIDNSKSSYEYSFAEWERTNQWGTFLDDGYFENSEGLISMIYVKNENNKTWTFDLLVYDGYTIDQKFAKIQINIENIQNETTFNQTKGLTGHIILSSIYRSFETLKKTFTIYYGEYFQTKDQKDFNGGQVTISFVNTDTNHEPFTHIDANETNVKDYAYQLIFGNQYYGFNTTSFSKTYPADETDKKIAIIYVCISVIIGSFSWYTRDLNRKVTLGNLQGFFAAASYIAYWAIIQPRYHGFWYWILLIPPVFNWFKLLVFILLDKSRRSRNAVIGTLLTAFVAALNYVPTVWINFFPIVVLFFPYIQKLGKNDERGVNYIGRFEVSNYLYLFLWMGYTYINPANLYFFETNGFIFVMSAIQAFIQCVLLTIFQLGTGGYNQPLLEKETPKTLNPDTTC